MITRPSIVAALDPPAWARAQLTNDDFARARRLLHSAAGIHLNDHKRLMVASRLAKRLRATGHADYAAYLDHVADRDTGEWAHFVNALTTNLTAFFREAHHFPILVQHIRREAERSPGKPITVWSAGCATGEEPYSIAIALVEAFGSSTPPVRIIASDIDTQALGTAMQGVYPVARTKGLEPAQVKRFFLRGTGAREGQVRVRPEIRGLVEFKPLNLDEASWDVPQAIAAIFCRNVLIYFARDTQHRVLSRFAERLAPDGLLFAGHSENLYYIAGDLYRSAGRTVYSVHAGANR